ncbi:MAG TPA: nuclear transport factor 2 family protein [Devosiaceae bacterium]|jgi:ketosteroid isomerase-like protein|nr:nuclear transport factor 2 family protein [Devosiaceae bacterium]
MLEAVPATNLGAMYRAHIRMILEKDIAGLLAQYAEDAVLISSFEKVPKIFKGHAELREHFNGILGINDLQDEIGFWGELENSDDGYCDGLSLLMITEGIQMADGAGGTAKMRFADSWVLRDGKIIIHFAGMVQYPDGSLS